MKNHIVYKCASLKALGRAVTIIGSKSALARGIEVTPQAVAQWFSQVRPIPAKRCRLIEQATSGAVTRYDLRPDIFGPVPEEQGSVAASVLTASLVTDYRGKESTG